jgi:hypothetical protein
VHSQLTEVVVPMLLQCRRAVRGVALPLSSLEYEDLSRLRRSALVICGEPAGSDAYTDAQVRNCIPCSLLLNVWRESSLWWC